MSSAHQGGYTFVEFLIAAVVFSILVIGMANAFNSVSRTYALTRQLNEMYAVLSACPEIDRALQYDSLSGSTNCFPNNTFKSEAGTNVVITYTPTLTVTPTSSLSPSDPLYAVPDSKVVEVDVDYPNPLNKPWKIRLLVTRNGISQL
jgi:Tfp pilus assembly protein PilE